MTGLLEETDFQTMPVAQFAEALAAATPTPGGSCAAAVPGALAAGLVAMAARLSAQSDPFSDLDYEMEAVASEADRLRAELLDLVDEDADAFDRVMAARRLPNQTLDRRTSRLREVQRAYRAALEPSSGVCSRSLRVLELAAEVVERGNPNVASDGGVAAVFAAASLEAAALNIEIGLGPVDDEDFSAARTRDAQAARRQAALLLDFVRVTVRRRMQRLSPAHREYASPGVRSG
jgi:formiminotetrahydrofolate cyclodeaminase